MQCKISQGVTTVITGNCGISLAPLSIERYPPPPLDIIGREPGQFFPTFDAYLSALDRDPPALNAACQVGHTTLRAGAMDRFDRAATPAEIDAMRRRARNLARARRHRHVDGALLPAGQRMRRPKR